MNNDFKATHVIVAEPMTSFCFKVGTQVRSIGADFYVDKNGCVIAVEDSHVEPIKAASLFTEAQLRELEGLYRLVRVGAK